MKIYGYVRYSPLKKEKFAEGQIAEMARKAEELGGSLAGVFVEPGSSGDKTAILDRSAGKEMLETLRAGDTLLVNRLDRLGCSMRDIQKTVEVLAKREVRIFVLHALDGEFDLPPKVGEIMFQLLALFAKVEKAIRSEHAIELAQQRKESGLAYGGVPMGKKIVQRDGAKILEWDMEQLGYIAEIAKRLPIEGAAKVAQDFWKRRVKDRQGRLWGKQAPKPVSRIQQANRMLRCLLGKKSRGVGPYQQFYRAAQWFHRMKRKGLLPPPYGELALTMQEPKRFRVEPKPKKWTPGGTARREQERAEAKAKHSAERQARWQREKEARMRSRVRKPKVELYLQEGGTEP